MEHILLGTAISFESKLRLESVGKLISKKFFSSIEFGGLDENIHEEIPAIYIKDSIMGFRIELDGDIETCYCLHIYFDSYSDKFYKKDINKCAFLDKGFREYVKFLISEIPELHLID